MNKPLYRLIIIIFAICAMNVSAITRYVSPDGNNEGSGTESDPWKTIQYGVSQIQGGDTLLVKEGIYEEPNIVINGNERPEFSGSPESMTTIMAMGEVHWMTESRGYPVINLKNLQYIKVDGFKITEQEIDKAISMENCSFCIICNNQCRVAMAVRYQAKTEVHGIYLLNCSYCSVENNNCSDMLGYGYTKKIGGGTYYRGLCSGITVSKGGYNDVIGNRCCNNTQCEFSTTAYGILIESSDNNTVKDNYCAGQEARGGSAGGNGHTYAMRVSGSDNQIINNYLSCKDGSKDHTLLTVSPKGHSVFIGNIFAGDDNVSFAGDNIVVANNIFYQYCILYGPKAELLNNVFFIREGQVKPCATIYDTLSSPITLAKIKGNIFVSTSEFTYPVISLITDEQSEYVIDYNVLTDAIETLSESSCGEHNLRIDDPLFRNKGTGNCQLKPESPCLSVGENGSNIGLFGGCYARPDADMDGLPDDWEVTYGLSLGVQNDLQDADDDGIINFLEFLNKTDPGSDPDNDEDGIPDEEELALYGTNPYSSDTDMDGWSDGVDPNPRSQAVIDFGDSEGYADGLYKKDYWPDWMDRVEVTTKADWDMEASAYIAPSSLPTYCGTPFIYLNTETIQDKDLRLLAMVELTGSGTIYFQLRNAAGSNLINNFLGHPYNGQYLTFIRTSNLPANGLISVRVPLSATSDGSVVKLHRYYGNVIWKDAVLYVDADHDGIDDTQMVAMQNNPEADYDQDGMADYWEYTVGMDFGNSDEDGNGIMDGDDDFDQDGLKNRDERAFQCDPLDADTDNDGLMDGDELDIGTDPLLYDTDDDGFSDGWEVKQGMDPLTPFIELDDQDGDGLLDQEEQELGSDPNNMDTDGDGLVDGFDGLVPLILYPTGIDRDQDGFVDGEGDGAYHTNPLDVDTDSDGWLDGVDPDPRSQAMINFGDSEGYAEGLYKKSYWPDWMDRVEVTTRAVWDMEASAYVASSSLPTYCGTPFVYLNTETIQSRDLRLLTHVSLSSTARIYFQLRNVAGVNLINNFLGSPYNSQYPSFIRSGNLTADGLVSVRVPLSATPDGSVVKLHRYYGTVSWEDAVFFVDADHDGIDDTQMEAMQNHPETDYDGDGMWDLWEYENGMDFTSNDAQSDVNNDGISNLQEFVNGVGIFP